MMQIEQQLLSVNFRHGRRAAVDRIVIHVTEGDADSVVSWFNNPKAEVSAHYMVRKDGVIVQFVREEDEAWAEGRIDEPTAKVVLARPNVNPNSYCISIEHEGTGREDLTGAQRAASIALVRDIAMRYKIPLDRDHVLRHHEIYALKSCPGAINVDTLVADAAEVAPPAPPTPRDFPRVVYSPYFGDYLIVTRYDGDTDWSFVPWKSLAGRGDRAQTPLSIMPAHP